MKSRILIAVAAVALATSGVKSQSLQIGIHPTSPTQYDTIMIYLAGWMPGCDCRYVECGGIERNVNTFNITPHIVDPGGDCGCEAWVWGCEYQIGVLEPGEYEIEVSGSFNSLVHFTVQESSVLHVPGQFTTIQAAVDAASVGDTVLMDRGKYSEHVEVGKNILLASQYLFSNDPTDIDSTVIDGDTTGTVMSLSLGDDASTAIAGLTIQRGNIGIVCDSGTSPSITSCVIQNNIASCYDSLLGRDCFARYCRYGYGVMISSADPTITNCIIRNNGNSGIFAVHSSALVQFTIVTENMILGDEFHIRSGGGICCYEANIHLLNCNLIRNRSSCIPVDGLCGPVIPCSLAPAAFSAQCTPILENCLVYGNSCTHEHALEGSFLISNTDIYGNDGGDWVGSIADQANINGNFSVDPQFCDTASDDYHLTSSSPCAAMNHEGVLVGALDVGCTATDVPDEHHELPTKLTLSQNYPNPFNPVTIIEYSVPFRTDVTIEIFNVLGQKVRTLVNETKPAGEYRIEWKGTDESGRSVSTGMYLYRFQAGDVVQTKKMLLLK